MTLAWDTVPCCGTLNKVAGSCSLQCRIYPGLDAICERFAERTHKFMRMGGFSDDDASLAQKSIVDATRRVMDPWLKSLLPVTQQELGGQSGRWVWFSSRLTATPGEL